jgi:hypothetical protein
VGAVLGVPLMVLYALDGPPAGTWWAVPAAVLCGGLAALVLASYVPVPGSLRRVDVGCTPCSAVAAATVVGSFVLRDTDPLAAGMSLLAVLLLAFGLAQRLSGAACAVPAGR